MFRILPLLLICLSPIWMQAQYNWELEKDEDGIQIYSSEVPYCSFKAVKVECIVDGDYNKLLQVLTDAEGMKEWVYNTKKVRILTADGGNDISYYSETDLPWPVANRDAVINLEFGIDSLPKYLTIKGTCDEFGVPKVDGNVRLSHFKADWKISKLPENRLQIEYVLEVDPGGVMPSWINNLFILKGPYQTFLNLTEKLKE